MWKCTEMEVPLLPEAEPPFCTVLHTACTAFYLRRANASECSNMVCRYKARRCGKTIFMDAALVGQGIVSILESLAYINRKPAGTNVCKGRSRHPRSSSQVLTHQAISLGLLSLHNNIFSVFHSALHSCHSWFFGITCRVVATSK